MAQWSLLHLTSPWQTTAGLPSMVRELTVASNRSFQFSSVEPATLTFEMPGNHRQTAALQPLVSDVLVYRDATAVQRFRVVSRVLSKDTGVLRASFSCVSYRGLLDGRIIHAADQRSFPTTVGAAAVEQTDIAWNLISTAQSRSPSSALGITRGPLPVNSQSRTLQVPTEGYEPVEYFDEGLKVGEAIKQLSEMDHGFEWDIVPNPAAPTTAMLARFWTVDDGGRGGAEISELLLNDGGSIASWTHTVTPSEYGNVVRLTGGSTTENNYVEGAEDPVWVPGENPAENIGADPPTPHEGRWEVEVNNSDLTTIAAVQAWAPEAYRVAHDDAPELTLELARGRWAGPEQLWLGDRARCVITEPVDGTPGEWILYLDEEVKVVEISINVDDFGAEDVSLSINRPAFDAARDAQRVNDRLGRIERR